MWLGPLLTAIHYIMFWHFCGCGVKADVQVLSSSQGEPVGCQTTLFGGVCQVAAPVTKYAIFNCILLLA